MFYVTSKFDDNCVNSFGFMEGGAFEAPPPPLGPGTPKKPRPNRVNSATFLYELRKGKTEKPPRYAVTTNTFSKCSYYHRSLVAICVINTNINAEFTRKHEHKHDRKHDRKHKHKYNHQHKHNHKQILFNKINAASVL